MRLLVLNFLVSVGSDVERTPSCVVDRIVFFAISNGILNRIDNCLAETGPFLFEELILPTEYVASILVTAQMKDEESVIQSMFD